jgi:hypothetical protein
MGFFLTYTIQARSWVILNTREDEIENRKRLLLSICDDLNELLEVVSKLDDQKTFRLKENETKPHSDRHRSF